MKLLKLPLLIQIEVYKHLQPFDYFMLSLCSLKVKQAIQIVNYKKAEIWISERDHIATFFIKHPDYRRNMFSIWFEMPVTSKLPIYQMEHNGKVLKISVKIYNIGPCIINLDPATSLFMFHQYICHLFGVSSTEVYCHILCELDERDREMRSLKIKKSILLGGESLHWEELDNFLEENPDQTYLEVTKKISTFRHREEIRWSSLKHLKVSNVIFRETQELSAPYMLHFKGEHGYFEKSQMSVLWVNKFLKYWIKRKEDKLKSMIFVAETDAEYDLNATECFDGLITQKCSLAERSLFPYQSIISKYQKVPKKYFNCPQGTEITRDTDGKTMTIVISKKHVAFFVWS